MLRKDQTGVKSKYRYCVLRTCHQHMYYFAANFKEISYCYTLLFGLLVPVIYRNGSFHKFTKLKGPHLWTTQRHKLPKRDPHPQDSRLYTSEIIKI